MNTELAPIAPAIEKDAIVKENVVSIGDFLQSPAPNGHVQLPLLPVEPPTDIRIDVGVEHLPTLNKMSWQAIERGNNPPILFQHGASIVRAVYSEDTGVGLQSVTVPILRHHLSRWAVWHKDGKKFAKPPEDVVKDVLASHEINLPRLRRITRVPVFCRKGNLVITPGFHEESGILYVPVEGFEALPIPETIAAEDVAAANKLICDEVLCDFPFADIADRDNAVALFLLPFVRDMILGPTPNHLIEASMPGSGKGKLASSLLYPAVGNDMGLITAPRDDDEWRKQITSSLLAAKPVVMIDNVGRMVDSPALAAAWTADVWDDRILGTKEKAGVPIRCIWVMTANNPVMSSELIRRSIRIRLTPKTDHPEDRTEFRHANLGEWIATHRAELVRAAHIIVKWWIDQGMPRPTATPQLGSYEEWIRVVGGVLECAGFTEFLKNKKNLEESADPQRMARGSFCSTWYDWLEREENERHRLAGCTATDILPIAEAIEGLNVQGASDKARATWLGKWLGASADIYVSHAEHDENDVLIVRQFTIARGKVTKGRQFWRVVLVE